MCEDCGAEAPPGYPDMAAARVGEAVAKLEEDGLTVQACNQFIQVTGTHNHIILVSETGRLLHS